MVSAIRRWWPGVSRPDRKFRFQPSRKFLLTTARLKDGTNRDEPIGTGRPALAEAGTGRQHDSARGRREDGRDDALGTEAREADQEARRFGSGSWAARAGLQSEAF